MSKVLSACKLYEGCQLVATNDGYCPRHSALVEEFGEKKALDLTIGFLCGACGERKDDEPQECNKCSHERCEDCVGLCCLQDEIDGLEDQICDLENELERRRRELEKKKKLAA